MGSDLRAENFLETLTLTALSVQNPKLVLVNDETDGRLHVPTNGPLFQQHALKSALSHKMFLCRLVSVVMP